MYDRFGHAGLGGAATGGFDPNAFSGFEDILGGLGDIFGFGDAFGGGRRRGGPQRGADLRYDLEISFEEAAKGTEAALQIPRQEICETCKGNGAAPGTSPITCPQCQGRGQIRYQQGFFTVARTCGQCRGTGSIVAKPCQTCRGAGRVQKEKKLSVRIPAGIATGQRLRLSGKAKRGPAADLPAISTWSCTSRSISSSSETATTSTARSRSTSPRWRSAATIKVPTLDGEQEASRSRQAPRAARRSESAAGACPTSAAAGTAICWSRSG